MTNLPENTSYSSNTGVSVPKVSQIFKDPAKQANYEAIRQKAYNNVNSMINPEGPIGVPDLANSSQINPSALTFKPYNQAPSIPTGTSFFDKSTVDTFERAKPFNAEEYGYEFAFGDAPGADAVLRTTPTMGQWIYDPTNPEKTYRSERPDLETWNAIRRQALDGRDTDVYEVDHVIPLWLGGTNNLENLQVLDRKAHGNKVKAEAVALTLFANGKISKDDAMKMAMTWQNRDYTDFPQVSYDAASGAGNKGQMVLSDAQAVYDKWKHQETTIPKVSMWENFFSKENALGRGRQVDKWTEGQPALLQGMIKGFLGAGSFGAIQYDKSMNNKGGWETLGNIAGNIGGSLLPVVGLSKLYGAALGLNKARTAIKGGLATRGILGTASKAGAATGNAAVNATEGVANAATNLSRAVRFSKGATDPAFQALIRAHADNFVRWTPAVVTYGQIQESFNDDPERGIRLMEDIIYGGITGFMSPDLKGAGKAAITTGLTTMMFDAYSENREVSWENALVNALLIGGLHQISAPAVRQQAMQEMNNEAARMANNMIGLYLPRLKPIKPGEAVPQYTMEEVQQITQEARETLLKQVGGSADGKTAARLSDEEFARQSQALGAALDVLHLNALPDEVVPTYLAQRMKQWIDLSQNAAKREEAFGGPVATQAEAILSKMPDDLKDRSIAYEGSTNYPSGVMRTTGLAENFNADMDSIGLFISRSAQGRVSPTLVAISRPERTVFNRLLTEDPNVKWTDSNPENTLQVFARTINEEGNVEYLNIGYIPQEARIDGGQYSFNSQPEIQQGLYPAYDKTLNKDTIGDKMKAEGLDYLFLTFRKADYVRKGGEPDRTKPFLEFEVGEQHWRRSIDHQNGEGSVAPRMQTEGEQAVLRRLNDSQNESVKTAAKEDFLQNYNEPAFMALDEASSPVLQTVDQEGLAMARSYLDRANEAMSAPTATEMAKKLDESFGFMLSDDAASALFDKRNSLTVTDFFKLVQDNSNPAVKEILSTQVYPPIKQLLNEPTWDKKEVFRQMRILGKQQKAPTPKIEVNEAIAAPTPEGLAAGTRIAAAAKSKTPELLPPASAQGDIPMAAPRTTQEVVATIYPKMRDAVEILIPESTPMRTSRQQRVDEIVTATIAEGKSILENIRFTKRNGEEAYMKALSGVVRNIEPNINKIAPVGGGERLSRQELAAIKQDVMDELSVEAERLFNAKINVDNAIEFKTGMKPGEELYEQVVEIQNALNARQLGTRRDDPLVELRQMMGDDIFEKAYRLLNPGVKGVKDIGKPQQAQTSKRLGIKGGLLGDVYFSDMQADSGKAIIKELVDMPKAARPGTYMNVFSDVLETAFSKQLGPEWRNNTDLAKVFSTLRNPKEANVWENLMIRSEGDATQPLEYIKSLGKGQQAKARRVADERREQVWNARNQQLDELASRRVDDEGVVSGVKVPEGFSVVEEGQVLAPAPIDTVMAGLTAAVDGGYIPTPEQAIADAIRFVFSVNRAKNIKFNTQSAKEVVDEVLGRLEKQGVRLSNVKDPMKKAGTYYTEARDVKSKADQLMTGELKERFQNLVKTNNPGKTPYLSFRGVNEGPLDKRIIALGQAMVKRATDSEYGRWKSPMTAEERMFADSFKKWQALSTEVEELTRSKDIMKLDAKAKDGAGYAPMDGKGGFFGDAWGKVKGLFNNTVEYTKPESQMAAPVAAEPREVRIQAVPSQPEAPKYEIPKPPQPGNPSSYNVKGFELSPEDFEDLTRVAFGEIGNRSEDKRRLEMQVFLDTIATRANQKYMGRDNIMDVVRQPQQYQGYGGPQYNAAKSGQLDHLSQQKYDQIRALLLELANSETQYPYPFYVHANDGTIRTGDDFQYLVDTYLR